MVESVYIMPFINGGIIGIAFAATVLLCAFLFDYLESEEVEEKPQARQDCGLDIWKLKVDGKRIRYQDGNVICIGKEAAHVSG